jgi:hypothetical protein
MRSNRSMAFMSYEHFADEHDNGYLTDFCNKLSGEVNLVSGEDFPIFQDRNDLKWGQTWKLRIDDFLDSSTFLIPIITPGFFKREYCRNELKRFLEREKKLNRNDLILPVYYVDTPSINKPSLRYEDQLAQIIASRQYADWRELRFEDLYSKRARKAINNLAVQIWSAIDRVKLDEIHEESKSAIYKTQVQHLEVNPMNLTRIKQSEVPIGLKQPQKLNKKFVKDKNAIFADRIESILSGDIGYWDKNARTQSTKKFRNNL